MLHRQEAVATSPCQRDVYAAMLVGTELSHAAYDVPKKFTGEYVLSALRKHVQEQLLNEFFGENHDLVWVKKKKGF